MDGDEGLRVSDEDRERMARRLARAQAEGRLELAEFDERVRAAYGATTRADLAPLTVDLPADRADEPTAPARPVERPAGAGVRDRSPSRRAAAAAVGVWAVVSAINLGIWVIVSLAASGPVHPWWIWVAGPWGVALALRLLAERSGLARAMPVPPGPLPGWGCGVRGRR